MSKKGLGRGLEALLPEIEVREEDKIYEVPFDEIEPNPYQPRKMFDESRIDELASSIREYGVLQPVILRRFKNRYQLIAGERRIRAARKAGLEKIPAVIREIQEARMMEIALIENLQREDLNPVDEAMAYRELMKELGMTQDQVADRIGKSRAQIANYVRLLNLDDKVLGMLSEGMITVGHAKVLLAVEDGERQKALAGKIVNEQLSVRQSEELIAGAGKRPGTKKAEGREMTDELLRAEDDLKIKLGAMVKLTYKAGKGKIEIPFSDADEFQRIMDLLTHEEAPTPAGGKKNSNGPFVV